MADIKLTPEVRGILEQGRCEGNLYYLPSIQLDRKLYEAVNKVLVLSGGKWKGGNTKAHVFQSDPSEKLGITLATGQIKDEKKARQAFFTPKSLSELVVELAMVSGEDVLEPSAGEGALADECLVQNAKSVTCIEIHEDSAQVLRRKGYDVTIADFLDGKWPIYSRIVMNPPFHKGQDIKHVLHALKSLKFPGILVSIMSPNIERKAFDDLIRGRVHEIHEVESGAFKESGTGIRTIILKIIQSSIS